MKGRTKDPVAFGANLDMRTRILLGSTVLLVLMAATTLLAWATTDDAPSRRGSGSSKHPAAVPGNAGGADAPASPIASPSRTSDPVVFAKAFAKQLWSYDTRVDTQSGHLAALQGWLTRERDYADGESVARAVPDPVLWSRMRDGGQYATADVAEGHIPASFTAALNAEPDRITDAYAYAVTVTGNQTIRWNGSGGGAEPRTVTLAVQCRPDKDCALVGITPNIAP
ncbi:hypothetical protein [Embleya sp. NPDC020630]|uniref:hypothetical protein n=1 Tax=Embleya sp. NPDC020630 TaxID=3363979 RepID=UPI0037B4B563